MWLLLLNIACDKLLLLWKVDEGLALIPYLANCNCNHNAGPSSLNISHGHPMCLVIVVNMSEMGSTRSGRSCTRRHSGENVSLILPGSSSVPRASLVVGKSLTSKLMVSRKQPIGRS